MFFCFFWFSFCSFGFCTVLCSIFVNYKRDYMNRDLPKAYKKEEKEEKNGNGKIRENKQKSD